MAEAGQVRMPGLWLNDCRRPATGSGTREPVRVCRVCLDKVFADMDTKDMPMGLFHPRPNFRMLTEECKYEDVQDISMSQITYNSEHRLINCSSRKPNFGDRR